MKKQGYSLGFWPEIWLFFKPIIFDEKSKAIALDFGQKLTVFSPIIFDEKSKSIALDFGQKLVVF